MPNTFPTPFELAAGYLRNEILEKMRKRESLRFEVGCYSPKVRESVKAELSVAGWNLKETVSKSLTTNESSHVEWELSSLLERA